MSVQTSEEQASMTCKAARMLVWRSITAKHLTTILQLPIASEEDANFPSWHQLPIIMMVIMDSGFATQIVVQVGS